MKIWFFLVVFCTAHGLTENPWQTGHTGPHTALGSAQFIAATSTTAKEHNTHQQLVAILSADATLRNKLEKPYVAFGNYENSLMPLWQNNHSLISSLYDTNLFDYQTLYAIANHPSFVAAEKTYDIFLKFYYGGAQTLAGTLLLAYTLVACVGLSADFVELEHDAIDLRNRAAGGFIMTSVMNKLWGKEGQVSTNTLGRIVVGLGVSAYCFYCAVQSFKSGRQLLIKSAILKKLIAALASAMCNLQLIGNIVATTPALSTIETLQPLVATANDESLQRLFTWANDPFFEHEAPLGRSSASTLQKELPTKSSVELLKNWYNGLMEDETHITAGLLQELIANKQALTPCLDALGALDAALAQARAIATPA